MTNDVEEKLSRAQALGRSGRYDEALEILKGIVTQIEDSWLRLTTAHMIATELSVAIRRQRNLPDPGTRTYIELVKYLRLFVESYDKGDLSDQFEFGAKYGHEVIGKRRLLLKMLADLK